MVALERLKDGLISHLDEQLEDLFSDIAKGGNDDLIPDVKRVRATKETIKQATAFSDAMLPLQNNGWSLPGVLEELFKALEPGISRDRVDSLLYHWDT